MRCVYRLQDAEGHGPFDGSSKPSFTTEDFQDFLDATVGQSNAIYRTFYTNETYGWFTTKPAERNRDRLEDKYGVEPVFGAPDKECFQRWFPNPWRHRLIHKGFMVVIYELDDKYVAPGNSEAEVVFVPLGRMRRCDPDSLEPVE